MPSTKTSVTLRPKRNFRDWLGGLIKLTILFFVLYAALRISTNTLREQANERALSDLYAGYRALPQKPPTIFIPGMMASVLKDKATGKARFGDVLQGRMDELALPIDGKALIDNQDGIIAGDTIGKFQWIPGVLELDLHGRVKEVAREIGGFKSGKDGFSFPWDWRRDIIEAVQQLDRSIQDIKRKSGNPNLKINLLCHSAGGIVARYYAKYGSADVLNDAPPVPTYAGAKNINKIIMLGTPNTGSIETFVYIHNGLWLPSVGSATAELIFSLPALYEIMPLEGKKVFIDPDGNSLGVDLYDPANWELYGWSVFNPEWQKKDLAQLKKTLGDSEGEKKFQQKLADQRRFIALVLDRAKKFQAALWAGDPVEEKKNIRYIVLGGDREPTLQGAVLSRNAKGKWKTEFKSDRSEVQDVLFSYGDMSVTKESVLGRHTVEINGISVRQELPLAYSVFIFSNHVSMTKDMTYLDNVLHAIFEEYDPQQLPKRKPGPLKKLFGLSF